MKRLVIFLLLTISLKSIAQDNCSPILKEIYNFEIGDKYNYLYTQYDWHMEPGVILTYHSLAFEVKNKLLIGDTTIYIIDGYLPPTTITQSNFSPLWYSRVYADTLILIDSLNHNLNQCAGSWVSFRFQWNPFTIYEFTDTIYSEILVTENENILFKTLGGADNMYRYDDGELVRFRGDYYYEEKYAFNLGLYSQLYWAGEFMETIELASYIKSGDTTVIMSSVKEPAANDDILIYPNPVIDKIKIENKENIKIASVTIYDYQGKQIYKRTDNISKEIRCIDISKFNKGIYLVVIDIENNKIAKKIIKK